jgi:prevent-host-death family protein
MEVSIRELKNNLSKYLKKVTQGSPVIITAHRHAVARIVPISPSKRDLMMFWQGKNIRWNGEKPRGGKLRVKTGKKSAAEMVLGDRR